MEVNSAVGVIDIFLRECRKMITTTTNIPSMVLERGKTYRYEIGGLCHDPERGWGVTKYGIVIDIHSDGSFNIYDEGARKDFDSLPKADHSIPCIIK